MGSTCSNANQTGETNYRNNNQSQIQQDRRNTSLLLQNQVMSSLVKKYVISQPSSKTTQIIIQLSNGSIESIPVKTSHPLLTKSQHNPSVQSEITHCAQGNIFFTNANKVYYMQQFNDIMAGNTVNANLQFMSIAHAYNIMAQKKYLLRDRANNRLTNQGISRRGIKQLQLMIPIDNMYLLETNTDNGDDSSKRESGIDRRSYRNSIQKQQQGSGKKSSKILLIETIQLVPAADKIVDLVDLGIKMKAKKICWQDRQFSTIIQCVVKKLYKLYYGLQMYGVSNIIIGSDGSVHLLGIFRDFNVDKNADRDRVIRQEYDRIRWILVGALYGDGMLGGGKEKMREFMERQEEIGQFKHPDAIDLIMDIEKQVQYYQKEYKEQMKEYKEEERLFMLQKQQKKQQIPYLPNPNTFITQPSLKFIRDYIQAYFYKLSRYSPIITSAYIAFKNYETARQILKNYIYVQKKYDEKVRICNNLDPKISVNFIEERFEQQANYRRLGEDKVEVGVNRQRDKRIDEQIHKIQKSQIQTLQEAYIAYQQLVSIQKLQYNNIPQQQHIQSINTLSLISYYLGIKYSQSPLSVYKQYNTAKEYFQIAVMYIRYRDHRFQKKRDNSKMRNTAINSNDKKKIYHQLEEYQGEYYVKFIQILQALNLTQKITTITSKEQQQQNNSNNTLQQIMIEGVNKYPQHKILHIMYIMYLCDCLRVSDAQKHLLKGINKKSQKNTGFSTLQHEICEAKIYITKALMQQDRTIKERRLKEAKDNLQNIVIEKYMESNTMNKSLMQRYSSGSSNNNTNKSLPYYYEILGDLCMINKNYYDAREYYHTAMIYHKKAAVNMEQYGNKLLSSYPSLYKLAIYKSAQANTLILLQQYNQAQILFKTMLANNIYITPQCRVLYDSMRGNYGILKIKQGQVQQGCKILEMVLSEVVSGVNGLMYDYNYVFLNNMLMRYKKNRENSEGRSEINRRRSSLYL